MSEAKPVSVSDAMTAASTNLLSGSIDLVTAIVSQLPPAQASASCAALSDLCLNAASDFDRRARLHSLKVERKAPLATVPDTPAPPPVDGRGSRLTNAEIKEAVIRFQVKRGLWSRADFSRRVGIPDSTIGNRLRDRNPVWRPVEIAKMVDAGVLPADAIHRYQG